MWVLLVSTELVSSPALADENSQHNGMPNALNTEVQPNIGRMGESAVVDVDEFEFSAAETKIWLSDHLQNVDKPARLYYEFIKAGSYEVGFTDAVYLDIHKINKDGSKDASLDFFTSDRRQSANRDNLTHITGNPVIGIYMQGDVVEMNRITDGHWRYFQRRIKTAISENAIEPGPSIFINPEDLEKLNPGNENMLKVESRRGSIIAKARPDIHHPGARRVLCNRQK